MVAKTIRRKIHQGKMIVKEWGVNMQNLIDQRETADIAKPY